MTWLLFALALAALVGALWMPSLLPGMACVLASLLLTVVASMRLLVAHSERAARQRRREPALSAPP